MLLAAFCAAACVPWAGPGQPLRGGGGGGGGISLDPLSREQFLELFRASHVLNSETHDPFGCAVCIDPMAGQLPPEALLDGPADVWN